jgi:hypothetical protein
MGQFGSRTLLHKVATHCVESHKFLISARGLDTSRIIQKNRAIRADSIHSSRFPDREFTDLKLDNEASLVQALLIDLGQPQSSPVTQTHFIDRPLARRQENNTLICRWACGLDSAPRWAGEPLLGFGRGCECSFRSALGEYSLPQPRITTVNIRRPCKNRGGQTGISLRRSSSCPDGLRRRVKLFGY